MLYVAVNKALILTSCSICFDLLVAASQVGVHGSLGDDLLEHILSDFSSGGGYELAMHWLFSLFAQHIPVEASGKAPQQLQQARASLSGSFSGFHPDQPEAQPLPSLDAPSGSGPAPGAAQEPHAAMDIDPPNQNLNGHARDGRDAGPAHTGRDGPEQALQTRKGQEAAAHPSGPDLPGAQLAAASSEPAEEASEHPDVVQGQTTEDVQHQLEGREGADPVQADARRKQGLSTQDAVASTAEAGQSCYPMQMAADVILCCYELDDALSVLCSASKSLSGCSACWTASFCCIAKHTRVLC